MFWHDGFSSKGCSPVLGFKLVNLTTVHSAAYAKLPYMNIVMSVAIPCVKTAVF